MKVLEIELFSFSCVTLLKVFRAAISVPPSTDCITETCHEVDISGSAYGEVFVTKIFRILRHFNNSL
jgi:hypothetical protein